VFVPLGREHTSTLRIEVGSVGRATPVGKRTARVGIDVCVANKVRLAVQRLERTALEEGSVRNTGETYVYGACHIHAWVE